MNEKDRQQSFSEYLDKAKENKLFVRFVFTPDFKEVEEFAVVYIAIIREKSFETMRYDCSSKEAVNVHQFFYRKPEKRYLNKEKCFETLQEFIEDIRRNWIHYRQKFLER
ncbi:MAG: hypothetical protein AB1467_04430 [Candidatus Diapherotrites archaeon]